MIDRNHAQLVDVVHFLHRLAEAHAQVAVFGAQLRAVDLHPLVGIGRVLRGRRNPVADDARADHIGDELVLLAIPREQRRTRTAAPVEFQERHRLVHRDVDLVLQHAGRPQHAHDVGVGVLAKSGENLRWPLAQIACAAGDFELLPQAVGENLDLRSQAGLIVGQALQVDAQRVVLVAALVVQDDRIAAQLRNDEIGRQIVVEVSGDQRTRIVQLQLVQPERRADVFESLRAFVAQHAQLGSLRGFDHRCQVDPSIVIEIDGGDAPALRRVGDGQRHALEMLAVHIAPEADARRAGMRQRDIHPAIFIEVEDVSAGRRRQSRGLVERQRLERSLRAGSDRPSAAVPVRLSDDQIHCAVIVDVGQHDAGRASLALQVRPQQSTS